MLTAKLICISTDFMTVSEMLASTLSVEYRKEILFDSPKFIYYQMQYSGS